MKHIAKFAAVFIYLLIMSVLLHFKLGQLFDIRQICLVILGMIILFLPGYQRGENSLTYVNQLAKCALLASYIQTFILLFLAFSTEAVKGSLMQEIAKNCRPILYGICLWAAFSYDNDNAPKGKGKPNKEAATATEIYEAYRKIGLTNREAELAIQIERGLSNGEIAAELNISETTVKKHISNIFEKLDINKREQIKEKRKSS